MLHPYQRTLCRTDALAAAPPPSDSPTPWKFLLTQKPVWAVIVSDAFMGGFAGGIFFAFVPTYMFHQLGFSLKSAGFMASIPYIAKLAGQLLVPQTADWLIKDGMDVTTVRKLYQGVPSIIGALCSLYLCLGSPGAGMSVLLMTITTAMDGPREALASCQSGT